MSIARVIAQRFRLRLRHPTTQVAYRHATYAFEMSSDADYAAFLDRANQDTGNVAATSQSSFAATKAVTADVPDSLQKIDKYYTSDTDEPWEPVSLKWPKDSLPDEGELQGRWPHELGCATWADYNLAPSSRVSRVGRPQVRGLDHGPERV